MKITALFIIASCLISSHAEECIRRTFNANSFVCVCNSTYCDSLDIILPERGYFRSWVSSKASQRLDTQDGLFQTHVRNVVQLYVDPTRKYQKILGFGGSFTDSAGLNIKSLSEETQGQLIKTYFSSSGSGYNLARVPIGGSDFSTRGYTLDDVENDRTLSNFSLTKEDWNYKLPYMKRALEWNPNLRFITAAWTAPTWMKTNHAFSGLFGQLKKEDYQLWADYLIKFLEVYKQNNVSIWAISTGNEPQIAFIPGVPLNDMGWMPSDMAIWVAKYFGPTLRASSSSETLLLALDDQRKLLPWYIDLMYSTNSGVDKYIDGISVHWYADKKSPTSYLEATHEKYPEKFLIMTEACTGWWPGGYKVDLGSWDRGEAYMHNIIENLNHWITGWIDWNLALSKSGGPNWVHAEVDSAIIVDPEADEFFKQPMYYALAHFSKFVPPESVRINLTSCEHIESIAFLTPQNTIVIVLYNPNDRSYELTIADPNYGNINIIVEERSFRTIVYRQ